MDYLILFVFGLVIGSFLNVVIFRLRFGGSPLKGRSLCDHCHRQIAWYDNIPLLSFLLLRGRCRHCHQQIPIGYPLVELLIGLEFVWVYWLLKVNFSFFGQVEGSYSLGLLIYWLILFSGSAVIIIYDIKNMLIPEKVLFPLTVVAFSRLFFSQQWQVLPVAIASFLFLLMLYFLTKILIKKEGIGFGDVELGFFMGLVLGWPLILIAYFLAFLTGAIWGVILIIIGKKKLKERIAFGPFLLLGMIVAKLWGWSIWQWYLGML